jgi:CRISPR-associated endonuclease/helicase Cas3
MNRNYYAHTSPYNIPNSESNWQLLKDHSYNVGELTGQFASKFSMEHEGRVIGNFHDVGKYADRFQDRLKNPNEITGINHWTPSSILLYLEKQLRLMLCVEGHHVGIPNLNSLKCRIKAIVENNKYRIEELGFDEDLNELFDRFHNDIKIDLSSLTDDIWKTSMFRQSMKIRMLFSCLIDADRFDTECHFNKEKFLIRTRNTQILNPLKAIECLERHYLTKNGGSKQINDIRNKLLDDCKLKSQYDQGIFNLTGVTGSGKTLSSLMFALKHALKYNLDRVIYVVPYTSIIDQISKEFFEIFKSMGNDYVLEHHSNVSNHNNKIDNRLFGIENWDRPIIITTNVQFFESLFSNHPSKCRKIHNISKSIIVLDEVQNISVNCVPPCLFALKSLVDDFGCSVVMGTATQPAFKECSRRIEGLEWNPIEISSNPEQMAQESKRTEFIVNFNPLTWEEWADQIDKEKQILSIVNTTTDAQTLFNLVKSKNKYHLSTKMVPKHRKAIIRLIKYRLKRGLECKLISTQLIEAGIDIDFPIVNRSISPLDSIIQSGGRCNREGKLNKGIVNVIYPISGTCPPGSYKTSTDLTSGLLHINPNLDFHSPATYREYYEIVYERVAKDFNMTMFNSENFKFQDIAECFHIIEQTSLSVIVPYNNDAKKLISNVTNNKKISMDMIRKLQKYTVNIFNFIANGWIENGLIKRINEDYELYEWIGQYNKKTGIINVLDNANFLL